MMESIKQMVVMLFSVAFIGLVAIIVLSSTAAAQEGIIMTKINPTPIIGCATKGTYQTCTSCVLRGDKRLCKDWYTENDVKRYYHP